MVKNPLLLVSVAFGVSFALSLFVNRDIKVALLTSLITVPATFSGIVAVNRKQIQVRKLTLTALEMEIYQLERWETQLNQSLWAIAAEKQRTEATINFLKTQLSQLYTQIAEQRSYKEQIRQDLITLSEHRRQLEAESHELQSQIYNYEQRKDELELSLRSIKAEKQNAEASFNSMPAEFKHLQLQVTERQHQKEELERDLVLLNRLKPQLEEKLHNLKNQIMTLEKSQSELNQSISSLLATRQKTENSIESLHDNQLQTQVAEKEEVGLALITIKEQLNYLECDKVQIEQLPEEWNEFVAGLPKYELHVLKALVEEGNLHVKIKSIAEQNITMPELLIDLINTRALNTIGDLIIEPGNESFTPKITEDYLTNVKTVIKIKEMN